MDRWEAMQSSVGRLLKGKGRRESFWRQRLSKKVILRVF
ncbi:hypothetical protein EMIT019CA3_10854 [Bacillus pseudomycoides]